MRCLTLYYNCITLRLVNIIYMRQVISLSFPEKTVKKIKSLSKKRGFKSVSGYVKQLIEFDEDLISEKELLESVKQARKEYSKGQTIKAKSMADLL